MMGLVQSAGPPAWLRGTSIIQITLNPLWARGLCPVDRFRMSPASVGDSALYGLDFAASLGPEERIVKAVFEVSGGVATWATLSGTVCAVWITWATVGLNSIRCAVIRTDGSVRTVTVDIPVKGTAMIAATPPDFAPNAYAINGILVPDVDGNPLILG